MGRCQSLLASRALSAKPLGQPKDVNMALKNISSYYDIELCYLKCGPQTLSIIIMCWDYVRNGVSQALP